MSDALTSFLDEPDSSFEEAMNQRQDESTIANELKPCPFCGESNLDTYYCDIEGWIAHIKCDDCDDMIGPMSEFKYETKEEAYDDAAKRWNTRPAAPVEGLVTVQPLYGPKMHVCWTPDNTPIQDRELVQLMPEGDYVTRSQSEAIIAAKDESIKDAKLSRDDWKELAKKLEADNAALTARVKELEHDLNGAKGNAKNALSDLDYWRGQYEALKAENEKNKTVKWDADGF